MGSGEEDREKESEDPHIFFPRLCANAGRLSAATWWLPSTLASRGCAWPRVSEMEQRLLFIL